MSGNKGRAGVKDDGGKLRFDLIPPEVETALAEVLTFGADKYTDDGWRTVPNAEKRYTAALGRHLNAAKRGETFDPESNLTHLQHALCNLAFLVALEEKRLREAAAFERAYERVHKDLRYLEPETPPTNIINYDEQLQEELPF